jgi:hypothetical protein
LAWWIVPGEFDGLLEAHRSSLGPHRGNALLWVERAGGLPQIGEVRELGWHLATGLLGERLGAGDLACVDLVGAGLLGRVNRPKSWRPELLADALAAPVGVGAPSNLPAAVARAVGLLDRDVHAQPFELAHEPSGLLTALGGAGVLEVAGDAPSRSSALHLEPRTPPARPP